MTRAETWAQYGIPNWATENYPGGGGSLRTGEGAPLTCVTLFAIDGRFVSRNEKAPSVPQVGEQIAVRDSDGSVFRGWVCDVFHHWYVAGDSVAVDHLILVGEA